MFYLLFFVSILIDSSTIIGANDECVAPFFYNLVTFSITFIHKGCGKLSFSEIKHF